MKKVLVGISGGVDSALSAYLLKKQNYEVIGIFLKPWVTGINCNWKEEYESAMQVCAHIDIPFLIRDYSKNYQEKVITNLVEEYKKGNTPNPDILCNRDIKFHFLSLLKKELSADFIATGHYARKVGKENDWSLYQASDKEKDQTYFLWAVEKKLLDKALFPIGDLKKDEVRKYAKKYKIPSAQKPDSFGLCFVGDINFVEFLKQYIPENHGKVLNNKGEEIGEHQGCHFFTIGQRHGFKVYKKENDAPLIVVSKNVSKNTITVNTKLGNSSNLSSIVTLKNENYFQSPIGQLFARTRHRGDLVEVEYKNSKVKFKEPILIASGQSLVLYSGEGECFGGGIIET